MWSVMVIEWRNGHTDSIASAYCRDTLMVALLCWTPQWSTHWSVLTMCPPTKFHCLETCHGGAHLYIYVCWTVQHTSAHQWLAYVHIVLIFRLLLKITVYIPIIATL